ncbi:MAG TPA: hypothetical protein VMI35_03245 [Puia sp.]|nr:hypothetical protein [Puia sp.]
MKIEFTMLHGEAGEWITDFIRDQLMEMYARDKSLIAARINLKEVADEGPASRVCEIELTAFGEKMFVHRAAESFGNAVRSVLAELRILVDEKVRQGQELPDVIMSTVKA